MSLSSFKFDEDDFRVGAEAHRRAPCSSAAGSVNRKIAKIIQSVSEFSINAGNDSREREKLAEVRMTGKLQGDPGFRSGRQAMGIVNEQDAGHLRVDGRLAKDRPEPFRLRCITIVDADDLQSIENNFFVFENANTRLADSIEISGWVSELIMITGDEIRA